MKTLQTIIDDIFQREGDRYHHIPPDPPTGRGGITWETYQRFSKEMSPGHSPTLTELQSLSHEDARGIVEWVLDGLADTMGLSVVRYEPLRLHLLDFGYNSGPSLALRWLQRVVEVPRTGKMDAPTRAKIEHLSEYEANLVHLGLLYARLHMIDMWTDAPENKKFEEGLENRVHSFSTLPIP